MCCVRGLSRGKHGGMAWLGRNREVREQPERLLKGTRAIISLAYPYGPAIPATRDWIHRRAIL